MSEFPWLVTIAGGLIVAVGGFYLNEVYVRSMLPASDTSLPGHRHPNLPPKMEQPIDDRYVLPAKASTIDFAQCLSTYAIVDGRDYTIKEVSSVYRVLIPTLGGRSMSVGYDECRDRLTHR